MRYTRQSGRALYSPLLLCIVKRMRIADRSVLRTGGDTTNNPSPTKHLPTEYRGLARQRTELTVIDNEHQGLHTRAVRLALEPVRCRQQIFRSMRVQAAN